MPTQTPPLGPTDRQSRTAPTNPRDPLRTPGIPGDPNPTDPNLGERIQGPRNSPTGEFRQSEDIEMKLSIMFVPEKVPMDEAIAAGYPANSRPYLLTMEKAFQLALLNSRT